MRIFGVVTAFFIVFTALVGHVFVVKAEKTAFEINTRACSTITDPKQKSGCESCMGDDTSPGVWTAIGCIDDIQSNPNSLLEKVIRFAMGIAGGIAFLLILFGGLQIMTSAGNPEQLNAGRELVTSAITGLLLIIFSIFILQFIGVNIIGIPGFK